MSSFDDRSARDLAAEIAPLLDYEELERLAELGTDLEEQLIGAAGLLDEAEQDGDAIVHARWLRQRCYDLHDQFRAVEARIESALEYETRKELELDRDYPEHLYPEPPRSSWA